MIAELKAKTRLRRRVIDPEISKLERWAPWILTIGGAIGALASLILSYEEYLFLKNPNGSLACDINPIIGCGKAISAWQGHVFFGIPNPLFGIGVFAAVMTAGVALLAGAKFHRWFWLGLQAGMLFGVLFVHWFIFQSLYVLDRLCPYCMVTWVVTISTFWYILLYGIRKEHIRLHARLGRINRFAQRHHTDILAMWFLAIIALIVNRFWYYFAG